MVLAVACAWGYFTFTPLLDYFRGVPTYAFVLGVIVTWPTAIATGLYAGLGIGDLWDELRLGWITWRNAPAVLLRITLYGTSGYIVFWALLLGDII